ncbi:MAG: hypothetical protein HDS13_08015 [Bacteroides sp.]|nr:hypothetical protein [Bacteroides sp.]
MEEIFSMEENNQILKLIVKECCLPLHFDEQERQFSFPFRHRLNEIWQRLRPKIRQLNSEWFLRDFNATLATVKFPLIQTEIIDTQYISNDELCNGELLELDFKERNTPEIYIKMGRGQYLNRNTGRGYTLSDYTVFKAGNILLTSEGKELGEIKAVRLHSPTDIHIALGRVFLSGYYRHTVSSSLWPIYEESLTAVHNIPKDIDCEHITKIAVEKGVGVLPLLSILEASLSVKL